MEDYKRMSRLRTVPTGVKGLDEMLGGGFPEGRVILLYGGPGAGKTIFSLQYLLANVKRGEAGVYVTLEEPLTLIKQNVTSFGWNLEKYEKKNFLKLLDLYMMPYGESLIMLGRRGIGEERDEVSSVLSEIKKAVEEVNAKHVVLDPITSITIHQPRAGKKRYMVGQIFQSLRNLGCTSIVTMEATPTYGDFYMESFLADGVLVLEGNLDANFKFIQTIRIEKMRGLKHDKQPRRYDITEKGLIVYYTEPVIE